MNDPSNPTKVHQRLIGLTGGIGMGKTTVSDYLAKAHHLPVLDADLYAREAVQPGMPIFAEIVERYGSGILLPSGVLDRHRLGDIIFNSPAERLWLEQKIHPYVYERLVEALCILKDATQHPIVVLVIPLLFEARMTGLVTETWVVYCSPEQQVGRLMSRDRMTPGAVQARIVSQMEIQKKIALADVILNNSSTQEALFTQVDQALARQPSELPLPRN